MPNASSRGDTSAQNVSSCGGYIGTEKTAILPAPKLLSTNSAKRADAIYFIKAASAAGGVPSKQRAQIYSARRSKI